MDGQQPGGDVRATERRRYGRPEPGGRHSIGFVLRRFTRDGLSAGGGRSGILVIPCPCCSRSSETTVYLTEPSPVSTRITPSPGGAAPRPMVRVAVRTEAHPA